MRAGEGSYFRRMNATQWPTEYPSRIDAGKTFARGHCFLVADDEGPLAVFSFIPGLTRPTPRSSSTAF